MHIYMNLTKTLRMWYMIAHKSTKYIKFDKNYNIKS